MLEVVINVSEGQNDTTLATIADAAGDALLDVHTDADHNRSVFTLIGEDAARAVAAAAVATIDLRIHHGVHPRVGAVDVVPFVPLAGSTMDDALAARNRFCAWAGDNLALPCFVYGPERSLPEIRRGAFTTLAPDYGPAEPHPSAGGCAVGARGVLVAYNLWLETPDVSRAKQLAAELRSPAVRALGLAVGDAVQVSMNLIAPHEVGPAVVFDAVAAHTGIAQAELVGLVPDAVLRAIPSSRWRELDLGVDQTIEARLGSGRGRR